MVEAEAGKLRRGGGEDVSMDDQRAGRIEVHPGDLVGDPLNEKFVDSKSAGFGNAPRGDELASNAIFELTLALEDKDARATLGHAAGEGCPAEASVGHPTAGKYT